MGWKLRSWKLLIEVGKNLIEITVQTSITFQPHIFREKYLTFQLHCISNFTFHYKLSSHFFMISQNSPTNFSWIFFGKFVSDEPFAILFNVNNPLTHLNIYKYPRIPYIQRVTIGLTIETIWPTRFGAFLWFLYFLFEFLNLLLVFDLLFPV